MDQRGTGSTSKPIFSEIAKQETTEETERQIHAEMRELLKEWIELTEPEKVQKGIDLTEQNAGKLFRNVADLKGKKRLFVCCDGTLQNAVGTTKPMSNVARLARSIYRIGDDAFDFGTLGGVPQLTYYSSGIGSNSIVGIDRVVAAVTGKGFTSTVLNAYCFISNNYNGSSLRDDVILVGYSRGAFAMRCLAQFISDVGLLRRGGLPHLGMFWELWLTDEKSLSEDQPKWKKKVEELHFLFFREAKIKVLAEWDPVKSLIWPSLQGKKQLANMTKIVPKKVENAFVAISLHEKRWSYRPVVWEQQLKEGQKVRQCLFLGSHSDIGGGNIDAGLSTISLYWMVARIKKACGARFDKRILSQFVIPERVRMTPRITRPMGGIEICLTTQALSEGNVSKSSWLWRLPRFVFLGLCFNGDRSDFLKSTAKGGIQQEGAQRDGAEQGSEYSKCKLEIHKSVNLIIQKWGSAKAPYTLEGFTYEGVRGWKSEEGTYLEEAKLKSEELELARAWGEVAENAQTLMEYLREEKQKEDKRKGKMVANNAGIGEQQLPEDQGERETDRDFDRIKDWKRWRGAVNRKGTTDLKKALIGHLGNSLENELGERSEDEPENELEEEAEEEEETSPMSPG
ncbi:hypothetical protein FHL15_006391 [Xylaria flabelliformis]|uniref:T6SS Phospholipase effector Tle1-like catalytic domain-containing protein n=1 Tax=Xylaria flabelliformis TaxID=2512241 RepID=A0A553HXP8_9PEZI|nr:hypothetical protein FHL15_006391 [Xylaria flabelliformis]